MTETARLLRWSDCRLFREGACHIFAIALRKFFADENYELLRVRVSYPPLDRCYEVEEVKGHDARHVICACRGFCVDIDGIEKEPFVQADLLQLVSVPVLRKGAVCYDVITPSIQFIPVTEDELLEQTTLKLGEAANRFHLFTDRQFVDAATKRALDLIQPRRSQFSVRSFLDE